MVAVFCLLCLLVVVELCEFHFVVVYFDFKTFTGRMSDPGCSSSSSSDPPNLSIPTTSNAPRKEHSHLPEHAGIPKDVILSRKIPVFPSMKKIDKFCSVCHLVINEQKNEIKKCLHCSRSAHSASECFDKLFTYPNSEPASILYLELLFAPHLTNQILDQSDVSGNYLKGACRYCINTQEEIFESMHAGHHISYDVIVPNLVTFCLKRIKNNFKSLPPEIVEKHVNAELKGHFLWKNLSLSSILHYNKLVGFRFLGHFYNMISLVSS